MVRWASLIIAAILAVSGASPLAFAQQARHTTASAGGSANISQSSSYINGEVLVKVRDRAAGSRFLNRTQFGQRAARVHASYSDIGLHHLVLHPSESVEQAIVRLRADPDVQFVEPNYIIHTQSLGVERVLTTAEVEQMHAQSYGDVQAFASPTPTPAANYQQSAAPIDMGLAWGVLSPNKTAVIVAVVDTGVDSTHSVFVQSGAIWVNAGETANNGVDDDHNGYVDDVNGWNFVAKSNNPSDDDGHGTHVAGIILGTSQDIRASTLQPAKIRIMPLKFLDASGSGTTSDAIAAINYAVKMGAKVINNSWGGGDYSDSLMLAIASAYNSKVVFVAAAGNSGSNNDTSPTYPANYTVPNVISVAASTDYDTLAGFSNFGASTVHVGSPGVSILSTLPSSTFGYESGTSMATPMVAGIAALMMREQPSMNAYQVKNIVMLSASSVAGMSGKVSSNARIDVYNAVSAAQSATLMTTQPAFNAAAAQRGTASSSGSSGGGCGRVAYEIFNEPQDPYSPRAQAMRESFLRGGQPLATADWRILIFAFVLLLPLIVLANYRIKLTGLGARRFERFNIEVNAMAQWGTEQILGQVSTISVGGLMFVGNSSHGDLSKLESGRKVTLTIQPPRSGDSAVKVDGQVVWNEQHQKFGIEFTEVGQAERTAIEAWTKTLKKAD